MDRITQEAFFDILQSSIWKKLPSNLYTASDVSMEELITMMRSHAILGITADTIASHYQLTDNQSQTIYRYVANLLQNHWDMNETISDIFSLLETNGIHAVLLKGQGLARLYPTANTRSIGDIDIYVGKTNYVRAQTIIDEYCHMPQRNIETDPSNIHGYAEKGNIKIETHYICADTAIPAIKEEYNTLMDSLLTTNNETVNIQGYKVKTPSPEVNMLYVFEHLLKHLRYEGAGFRQFIDWLLTIRHWTDCGAHNKEWLRETLIHFHIMDAWQVLGGILVFQLGLPMSSFPFWNESKARHSQGRNLQYIIDSGNLGHETAYSKGYYFMPHSIKRKVRALCYYARYITMFEYFLFPYDTIPKYIRRTIGKPQQ